MQFYHFSLRPWSHRPCDQVTIYVRRVEQPNRRGSQINRATIVVMVVDSLTIKISRKQVFENAQKNLLLRSQIVGGRTQVLHSSTIVARSVAGGLVRSWVIVALSSRTTGRTTSRASLRPVVRPVVWLHNRSCDLKTVLQLVVTSKDQYWRWAAYPPRLPILHLHQ